MKRNWVITALLAFCLGLYAQGGVQAMRRPLSTSQPMWIVHIDSWNYPDPEKIINLIPEDIRPFVVFNISLSSNDNATHNGPRIADSWLKSAAAHQAWCMIQPSSGAHNRLPEIADDGTGREAYEQYFRDYPNFIGFSFAEQFWDFGKNGCPTWEERQVTYLHVLELCRQYGGYMTMSFTQAYDNCLMMPMAILKNNPDLLAFLSTSPEHFICLEKTTMKKCFYDIESNCLGMWLSGYAGHYGIRYDTSGWMGSGDSQNDASNNPYVEAAGIAPIIEHMLLTGQTVLDGPELTWQQVTSTYSLTNMAQGYKTKSHMLYPHCINIYADIMRKLISGEWRILSRAEVIARTKVCILNDITTGTREPYVTPKTLFDGLYRFEGDAGAVSYGTGWQDQRWWMKSSGRYPAIPQVYGLNDSEAQALTAIPASTLSSRWSTISKKQNELNKLFPKISIGDLYVAKEGNLYVTYNPYQYHDTLISSVRTFTNSTRTAQGTITSPTIPDGADISVYLNNYCNDYLNASYAEKAQQTNVIRLIGLTSQPQVTLTERGNHTVSTLTSAYANGELTITVTHNGPVDIRIASVHASAPSIALTYAPYTAGVIQIAPTTATIIAPASPAVYTGTQQYEAENMDYQGTSVKHYTRPSSNTLTDYYGQGYLTFMPNKNIYLRDTVCVPAAGQYTLTIRYQSTESTAAVPMTLRVNGTTVSLPSMPRTSGWNEVEATITLREGNNVLLFSHSSNWTSGTVALDMIQIRSNGSQATGDAVANGQSFCTKVLKNGQVMICRNGMCYDILGRSLGEMEKKGL